MKAVSLSVSGRPASPNNADTSHRRFPMCLTFAKKQLLSSTKQADDQVIGF